MCWGWQRAAESMGETHRVGMTVRHVFQGPELLWGQEGDRSPDRDTDTDYPGELGAQATLGSRMIVVHVQCVVTQSCVVVDQLQN